MTNDHVKFIDALNKSNAEHWIKEWRRGSRVSWWEYCRNKKHVRTQALRDLGDLALHMYGSFAQSGEKSRSGNVLEFHPDYKLLDMAPNNVRGAFRLIFHSLVKAPNAQETMSWLRLKDMLRLAQRLGIVDWKAHIANFYCQPN